MAEPLIVPPCANCGNSAAFVRLGDTVICERCAERRVARDESQMLDTLRLDLAPEDVEVFLAALASLLLNTEPDGRSDVLRVVAYMRDEIWRQKVMPRYE